MDIIRIASEDDAAELLEIYRPYVEKTAVSFEYTTPSLDEFSSRIKMILMRYPYLIFERDHQILGYCYAGQFKARKAYDWSVETTIYVKDGFHQLGIGKALYGQLEAYLTLQNVLNVNACIASTEKADEYLSNGSRKFHKKLGYQLVGTFHKCGYKFDRWYDMIWMEKMIGSHTTPTKEFIPFPELIKK